MRVEELVNEYYEKFTENDRYICQCILNHKEDCIHLTIDDFSYKYHVSTSSLSRFAQKMGLPGYSELKVILRFDHQDKIINVSKTTHLLECYDQVIDGLKEKNCTKLFEKMVKAERIIIFGESYNQSRVAKEMKRIFLPTGKLLYDVYGYDMVESLSEFIKAEDVIFFISLNGEQDYTIHLAKQLKVKGVYTISITKMKSNRLSHICDENFYIQSLELDISKTTAYEVTTPYFILVELLFVKYKMYLEMNIIPEIENKI